MRKVDPFSSINKVPLLGSKVELLADLFMLSTHIFFHTHTYVHTRIRMQTLAFIVASGSHAASAAHRLCRTFTASDSVRVQWLMGDAFSKVASGNNSAGAWIKRLSTKPDKTIPGSLFSILAGLFR